MKFSVDAYHSAYVAQITRAGELNQDIAEAEIEMIESYSYRDGHDTLRFNEAYTKRTEALSELTTLTLAGEHDESALAFMLTRLVDAVSDSASTAARLQERRAHRPKHSVEP